MSFAVLKTGVLTFRWQSVFTSVSLANEVFFPPGRHPAKREGRKGKKEGRKTEKKSKKNFMSDFKCIIHSFPFK
jgi:hypothetical protein